MNIEVSTRLLLEYTDSKVGKVIPEVYKNAVGDVSIGPLGCVLQVKFDPACMIFEQEFTVA